MSQKTIYICDHCKVEAEQKPGVYLEFMYVSVELRRNGSYGGVEKSKSFHVCPACQEKMGFIKPNKDGKAEYAVSTADQLYDLVAQIVQENRSE